jgi:uncharacterized LabA/DUF88 family protein
MEGKMSEECSLFIDFENIRYGLLKLSGEEPNFSELLDKVKKYGHPTLMKAYADFSEHPESVKRQLQILGIDSINVTVKKTSYKNSSGKEVERIKNASDMFLALDAIMEAEEANTLGKKKTFIIATGDKDYIRLVALLRHRFNQEVVICGIPGEISADLERAANITDNFDIKRPPPTNIEEIKKAICEMIQRGPSPLEYWSMRIIDSWILDPRQKIPGTAKEKRDALSTLKAEGVLIVREREDPRRGKRNETILDVDTARKNGYIR